MRFYLVCAIWLASAIAASAEVRLTDADTIVVDGIKYRLDGIDAPGSAQKCIGVDGKSWLCGRAATSALQQFIAGKAITCTDQGPDSKYPNRQIGRCFAGGVSIEHWLVREGWAIEFKKHSDGRFAAEELDASTNLRGIWSSCFSDPRDFRYTNKTSAVLRGQCPQTQVEKTKVRDELFGTGFYVKAKVFSAKAASTFRGIYHTEGCGSYGKMASEADGTKLMFFASTGEAETQGFRKAKNCLR